ncbi:MAG: guanylate kinase [Firmicutes bacterium]|nr:guanylate kinase [Bacillota bacterium]
MNQSDKSGLLIIISGPAGTGKGTVIKALRERNSNIKVLPSVTTRSPRKGEKEGYNYYFRTKEEFEHMIENNEFVEWVEYCENYYGTPRKQLEDSLKSGTDIVLEKEVEGAIKIKVQYPDSVLIFLLPPSFKELKRRIESRGTEDICVINKRLERASEEITYVNKYDYVITNDRVIDTANAINCIIKAEKLKTKRNVDILDRIVL